MSPTTQRQLNGKWQARLGGLVSGGRPLHRIQRIGAQARANKGCYGPLAAAPLRHATFITWRLYQATIRPLALVSCVQRRRSTLSNTSTRIA
jgi:hypothetical protein